MLRTGRRMPSLGVMNMRAGYVCLGAASIALPLSFVGPAWSAQVVTISSISSPNDMGKIGEAAAATSTIVDTATGALSISGGGAFIGTAPTVPVLITVNCANGGAACSSGANGKITPLSATGRLGTPTTFNVAAGTVTPTGATGATVTYTLPSIPSGTSTFKLGLSVPVDGDNIASTGTATYGVGLSRFQVVIAAGSTAATAGATGAMTATMYRAVSISKVSDLLFGTIVRPASGSGSATIAAATGSLTVSNGFSLASSTHSRAQFNVVADAASNLDVSVPASMVMSAGANNLTLTLLSTTSGVVSLTGSIGAATTLTLGVGGTIAMTNTTPSGHYVGTFTVSVNYQ